MKFKKRNRLFILIITVNFFSLCLNFSLCHRKKFSLCLKIFPCVTAKLPVVSLSGKSKNQIPCLVTLKFNGGSVKIVNKSRILPIEALWIYYLQIYKSPGKVTQIYISYPEHSYWCPKTGPLPFETCFTRCAMLGWVINSSSSPSHKPNNWSIN